MAPCLRQRGSIVGGIITLVPSVGWLPTSAICGPTRCASGRAREWLQLGGYPAHMATTPLTPVGHAADSRGLAQCGCHRVWHTAERRVRCAPLQHVPVCSVG